VDQLPRRLPEALRVPGTRNGMAARPVRNGQVNVARDRAPCDKIFAQPFLLAGLKVTQAAGRTSLP
jgi:hypothetical protein